MAGVAKRELSRELSCLHLADVFIKNIIYDVNKKVRGLCDGVNGLKDIYYQ